MKRSAITFAATMIACCILGAVFAWASGFDFDHRSVKVGEGCFMIFYASLVAAIGMAVCVYPTK